LSHKKDSNLGFDGDLFSLQYSATKPKRVNTCPSMGKWDKGKGGGSCDSRWGPRRVRRCRSREQGVDYVREKIIYFSKFVQHKKKIQQSFHP